MNILPKKRWHVRTRENITRVRKDEAAAREEEQKRQEKLELAESEARINFLRKKSGLPEVQNVQATADQEAPLNDESTSETSKHVDLFSDFKSHIKTTNKDLEKEQKEDREKYEKQIGYLTYLGQDTNEALKLRSWYEVAPKRRHLEHDHSKIEKDTKNKHLQDPLTLIHALLPPDKPKPSAKAKPKRKRSVSPTVVSDIKRRLSEETTATVSKEKKQKKHKTHKKSKKHKKEKKRREKEELEARNELLKLEKLNELRKERLKREAAERARQEALLAPKELPTATTTSNPPSAQPTPRITQKYNSQFNPEIAKQNLL